MVSTIDAPAVRRRARLEEVHGSLALAGFAFARADLGLLLERGVVPAGASFAACVAAVDYASAAESVRRAGPARPGRPLVALEEILALHALAVRRDVAAHPGRWRTGGTGPLPGGVVASPPWFVARDVVAYVRRTADGPPPGVRLERWLADAHGRFLRIQAFGEANGRVSRLVLNLTLRRLGRPAFVVTARAATTYRAALVRAAEGDLVPLAATIGRALVRATRSLAEGPTDPTALRPLASVAAGVTLAAAYKAAERGRLQTVRHGATLLTTDDWFAAYRASRAPAGRRGRDRPCVPPHKPIGIDPSNVSLR